MYLFSLLPLTHTLTLFIQFVSTYIHEAEEDMDGRSDGGGCSGGGDAAVVEWK